MNTLQFGHRNLYLNPKRFGEIRGFGCSQLVLYPSHLSESPISSVLYFTQASCKSDLDTVIQHIFSALLHCSIGKSQKSDISESPYLSQPYPSQPAWGQAFSVRVGGFKALLRGLAAFMLGLARLGCF